MNISLRSVNVPVVRPPSDSQPTISAQQYDRRMADLYAAADCHWVLVYGDREHAANLAFLTQFDPRFEEAVLLLGPNQQRTLIVGNEGIGYISQIRPALNVALCQTFGLMGQPRNSAPRLDAVLRELGLREGDRVGMVGWKYLEAEEGEHEDIEMPAFMPAWMLRHVQRVIGPSGQLHDVTATLMHPTDGLKAHNTAAQIAVFEWAAQHSSAAVQGIIHAARPGQRECDLALVMSYPGLPFSCHPMLNSASPNEPVVGLRSAGTRTLRYGDGVFTAIGYVGALCARGGLLRGEVQTDFLEHYVKPYYGAVAAWYQTVRVGVDGAAVHHVVWSALTDAPFKLALNPGHLISLDEWTHTPIREDSTDRLSSGMALQCDIIPAPMPNGYGLNCEDGVALADATLRAELAHSYPALWQRIQARRQFMQELLGLRLDESLLPLADTCALLSPFWLAAEQVCGVDAS